MLVPVSQAPGRCTALLQAQDVPEDLMVLPVCCQIRDEQLGSLDCLPSHILVLQTQQCSPRSQP